jgi:thioredoxin-like negative regulator of GroEL
LELVKVNADKENNMDLLAEHNVVSLPTFVLLDSKGKSLGTKIGAQSDLALREWIDTHVETDQSSN